MIKPLPGYVIIEPEKKEETDSGIVLAHVATDKWGKVISISEPVKDKDGVHECPVKVGEIAFYEEYIEQWKENDTTYYIVAYHQLIAVKNE